MAQQITVKGVVKDAASGEPILGANIIEKGTTNGTITNLDGEFSLNANSKATLVVKYVGYEPQEIAVAGKTNLTILLKEDAIAISEVMVIGYGTVKKNDVTGSITAIKPDALNKGLTTNAQDMITGKIAGVSVVSGGGTPGGGATIRIRGGSSLSASNDPLIVIDGLAMDNEGIKGVANLLSTINPNDIESFTVLKDASATAIYGSRASNGVIIINTKKGEKNQKPKISYEGSTAVSVLGKRYDVLTGDEFRNLVNSTFPIDTELATTNATNQGIRNQLGTYNTDWQDQIYQNAISQDHNISVTGGYKNIPYRASVGYTNQNGILKTSNFQRVTGALSLSPSFFDDHLKVNVNAKGMYVYNRYADGGAIGQAVTMNPTLPVTSEDEPYKTTFGGYVQSYNVISGKTWYNTLAIPNPVATLMLKNDVANSTDFIGNVEFDYKFHFLPEMRAHLNLGTDQAHGVQDLLIQTTSSSDSNWGRIGSEEKTKFNNQLNFWLQYAKEIDKHNFDVMMGYEWQHFYREGNNFYRSINNKDTNGNGVIDEDELDDYNEPKSNAWKSENKLVSFFGRANYSFANRYLLTATFRLDGSSRFSPKNRWGQFPSFAFAWKVKEEEFMSEVDAISDLKVRLGYGITGQQEINQGDYPYIPVYEDNITGAYYPFETTDGQLVYYPTSRPNAYNERIKWEETTTYNGGLDFGFFNSRLTGNIDYYFRETNNLLNVVDIPMGTNFSNRVISNIGTLQNEGIELALTGRIISKKDMSWEVGFNATHNADLITKLTSGSGEGYYVATGGISSGVGGNIQAHAVGLPAYSFLVYKQVYDDNGKPIEGEFADLDENGTINSNDMYYYKKPTPDLTMGLTSKFIYKNFDFSFAAHSSFGNYMYNDVAARNHNMSDTGIYSSSGEGYFINKPASAIETNFTQNKSNVHFSDYYVQDASFVRIDNISLGYTFKNLFKTIKDGRIYVNVQNPVVFTKYTGLDPEIFGGIDKDLYPRPIVTMLGLSLKF